MSRRPAGARSAPPRARLSLLRPGTSLGALSTASRDAAPPRPRPLVAQRPHGTTPGEQSAGSSNSGKKDHGAVQTRTTDSQTNANSTRASVQPSTTPRLRPPLARRALTRPASAALAARVGCFAAAGRGGHPGDATAGQCGRPHNPADPRPAPCNASPDET
eukprot:366200-Chlamydomonas_euryale.AAC.14